MSPVRGNLTQEKPTDKLVKSGIIYLDLKNKLTALTKERDKFNTMIKDALKLVKLVPNGKHREILLPVPASDSKILFRIQVSEKVGHADNAVETLRNKLGKEAETWIVKTEMLHPSAIEQLYTMGKLTDEDVKELTTVGTTESLIVKLADND